MNETRWIGLAMALGGAVILCIAYLAIPPGTKFPAIVLAIPLVISVSGLFRAIVGAPITRVSAIFDHLPIAQKALIVGLLLSLLALGSMALYFFTQAFS